MTPPVAFCSLAALAGLFRRGEASPVDVTRLFLDRIALLDPGLHAFVTVADRALADARAAEQRLRQGDENLLTGIPIAVKDSLATEGLRTTANSHVLESWVPCRDAAAIERLRQAGAVIIGKTNLNEFGWSIPDPDDLCPPPRNPWNPALAAIGSSSGSGAAVAAGLCSAALGTDSGGSVRLPAGQMGLVGLKPTHALISRTGSLHAGPIGDVGPMTRTVEDTAILLTALAGFDATDPDAEPRADVDYVRSLDGSPRGLRLGVPWTHIESVPVEPDVRVAFDTALAELARVGVGVTRVALPILERARAATFVILNAEHYAAHAQALPAQWERYGRSARLYHAQGAFVTAADYAAAQAVGRLARRSVDTVLRDVDALAMPVSPVVTAEAARQAGAHRRGLNASFTAPFNVTGHPALAMPCGMSTVGLPIGLQLTGRHGDESTLLRLAHAYEQATPWHTLHPHPTVAQGRA